MGEGTRPSDCKIKAAPCGWSVEGRAETTQALRTTCNQAAQLVISSNCLDDNDDPHLMGIAPCLLKMTCTFASGEFATEAEPVARSRSSPRRWQPPRGRA